MVVACDKTDQHHRLSAIVEKSMQCLKCALAILGQQVITQLKIRELT